MRGFGRRRPDVALTVLRFTNFIGPHLDTSLTRYLSLPVVPTVLGYDPRMQLCHEDDALAVLRIAALTDHVRHRQRRRRRPAPALAGDPPGGPASRSPCRTPAVPDHRRSAAARQLVDVSPEQIRFLEHGRVADVRAAARRLRLPAALHHRCRRSTTGWPRRACGSSIPARSSRRTGGLRGCCAAATARLRPGGGTVRSEAAAIRYPRFGAREQVASLRRASSRSGAASRRPPPEPAPEPRRPADAPPANPSGSASSPAGWRFCADG